MNLEQQFLDDIHKNCRSIITIGGTETGKTFLMLKCLTFFLNNNMFEEYHLVLPAFKNEQHNSYKFLQNIPNVFIYLDYDDIILPRIQNIAKKKRVFFCLDDGTGKLDFRNQDNLNQIITTTRHINMCIWLIMHASTGIISKTIRSNVKYVFLTNFENEAVLHDDIFKQYISLAYGYKGFNTFRQEYKDTMENNEYGQILIARNTKNPEKKGKSTLIDMNVPNWQVMHEEYIEPKKEVKAPVKQDIKQDIKPNNSRGINLFSGKFIF